MSVAALFHLLFVPDDEIFAVRDAAVTVLAAYPLHCIEVLGGIAFKDPLALVYKERLTEREV